MWRVFIADDEPKIRRGIRKLLEQSELGIEVVGEAGDGKAAFEIAQDLKPDILLLDICMPFINGLQLVEKLNAVLGDSIIILVTGYDEFSYAQQALKLQVFDYILKPVMKDQMFDTIERAKEKLSQTRIKNRYMNWAKESLKKNLTYLKECFFNDWLNGHLSQLEIDEQIRFLGLQFSDCAGIIIIKILEKLSGNKFTEEWNRNLLLYAVQNIVQELLEICQPNEVFRDNRDNIVAITSIESLPKWFELGKTIESVVEKYLNKKVMVGQKRLDRGLENISSTYENILEDLRKKSSCTPIVLLARQYVDRYSCKENLTLQEVAEGVQVSPPYLSRLFKQELGLTFTDYLSQVRIKKAIDLMADPTLKVYEIAEQIGYSSQHYFSNAFKKILGVSPMEYRRGEHSNL